ncbi:unnamed protein product [Closterium sp. NIES-65]|nr:unnamed protein product [Closterium sp. NIES-65]
MAGSMTPDLTAFKTAALRTTGSTSTARFTPRHAPAKRLERRSSLSPLAQLQEFYQVQSPQEQRPLQGTGERMLQGAGERKGEREGKQHSQLLMSQQRQPGRNQSGAVTRLGRRSSIDLADVAAARAAAAAAKESPSARGYEASNNGGAATTGSSPAYGGARRLHLSNRQTSGDWAAYAAQGKNGAQNTRAQAHEQQDRSHCPFPNASAEVERASPRLREGGGGDTDPAHHAQYVPPKSPRAARLPLGSPRSSANESAGPPMPALDPTQAGMLFSAVLHRGKGAGSLEAPESAEVRSSAASGGSSAAAEIRAAANEVARREGGEGGGAQGNDSGGGGSGRGRGGKGDDGGREIAGDRKAGTGGRQALSLGLSFSVGREESPLGLGLGGWSASMAAFAGGGGSVGGGGGGGAGGAGDEGKHQHLPLQLHSLMEGWEGGEEEEEEEERGERVGERKEKTERWVWREL